MPRRFRFVTTLALLVASVAGLSACGDDEGGSNADAGELLKATFGPDHKVESGKLDLSLSLDAKGLANLSGPVSLKLTGPFASSGKGKLPKLDLAITLSGSGANFAAGAVSTGDKGWLRLQGTTFVVDDKTFQEFKKGYEESASKSGSDSGPSFESLGIDPVKWLKDPKVQGTESVGGAETEHITAGVDVAAFLEDVSTLLGKAGELGGQTTEQLPSTLTDQQKRDIEASVKNARLEIWTGSEDRTLRRIKIAIGIDVPEAVRARAGGLTTGKLGFDLVIAELNEEQTINEPKNARPLSELRELIAGGATGGTSTAPTTTVPQNGETSEYLTCLQEAGSDVAKIQQCATLVGQ